MKATLFLGSVLLAIPLAAQQPPPPAPVAGEKPAEAQEPDPEAAARQAEELMEKAIEARQAYCRAKLEDFTIEVPLAWETSTARNCYLQASAALKRRDPATWEAQNGILETYERLRETTHREAQIAPIMQHAQSEKVRMTAAQVAEADRRYRETWNDIPKGEGELFAAARKYFEAHNRYEQHVESGKKTTQALEAMVEAQKHLYKLRPEWERPFFEKEERIGYEWDRLTTLATDAWRSQFEAGKRGAPDAAEWEKAKAAFDQAVNRKVEVTLRGSGPKTEVIISREKPEE